jgi:tetratricopeptide (TPR) repeat protein
MRKRFVGKNREDILNWLHKKWLATGSSIGFLEGSPGVGKTDVAHDFGELAKRQGTRLQVFNTEVTDCESPDLEETLMSISATLSQHGLPDMEDYIFNTRKPVLGHAVELALEHPILIVIDEAQRLFRANSGSPVTPFMEIFAYLRTRSLKGRLLLLSDRIVERAKWSEWIPIRHLTELQPQEAIELLDIRLRETGVESEISVEQKKDAVRVLNRNPRAIEALAAALRFSTLEEIIERNRGFWTVRDRDFDRSFLLKLEQNLLAGTMRDLEPSHLRRLWRLAAYRRSFKREALDRLSESDEESQQLYSILLTRFLVHFHGGSIALNPIVREIALTHLRKDPNDLRLAHSAAADYYLRHFRAKQILAPEDKLSESFAELRYHLVQAGRPEELRAIGHRYTEHLKQRIKEGAPIPSDREQLDERISVLTVLLEEGGAKSLEYHLARCLQARNKPGDLQQAIKHVSRAVGPTAWQAWHLFATLESELAGVDVALRVVRRALASIANPASTTPIYQIGADILAKARKSEVAVELLLEGIARVPAEGNLFSLYDQCAALQVKMGRISAAVELLRKGTLVIPPDKNLFSLYRTWAEILSQAGEHAQAVDVLREGIRVVPPGKNLFSLFQALSEVFCRDGKPLEAIAANLEGARRLPADNGHKLIEGAILLGAGCGNKETLKSIINSVTFDRRQAALGNVLLLQLEGKWSRAAEMAKASLAEFPRYLALASSEALSRLALGDSEAAWAALNRFQGLTVEKSDPHSWLAAFIHLRRNAVANASAMLAKYLGREVHQSEVTADFMLRLWDQEIDCPDGDRLCFTFPVLPSALTGLTQPICRVPFSSRRVEYLALGDTKRESAPPSSFLSSNPEIYVSYAWGEDDTSDGRKREEIVERLCKAIRDSGKDVGRDKERQSGGSSIDRFAQEISRSECIVAVISEKFLHSEFCMPRELFRAFRRCDYQTEEFQKKVIAVVLDDAMPYLRNKQALLELAAYWKTEHGKLSAGLEQIDPQRKSHDVWVLLELVSEMVPRIPGMLHALMEIVMIRGFDEIVNDNFKEIIGRLPNPSLPRR